MSAPCLHAALAYGLTDDPSPHVSCCTCGGRYGKQLDFEAMYTPDPSDFIARVLRWIDRRRPAQVPREMLDPEADGYV